MHQEENYTGILLPHYIAEKNSTQACMMQNLDKYCSAEQLQYLLRQLKLTKQANHKLERRSKSDGKKIKLLAEIVNTQHETISIILQKVGNLILLFLRTGMVAQQISNSPTCCAMHPAKKGWEALCPSGSSPYQGRKFG